MNRPPVSPIKTVELDANQLAMWSEVKAYMQFKVPSFTHLFYRMMNPDQTDGVVWFTDDPRYPTAATDGLRIIANADYFFKQCDLHQRAAVICHEIGHALFHHCAIGWAHISQELPVMWNGNGLPYVFVSTPTGQKIALANIAQDYVINAMLVEAKIGKLKESWCYNEKFTSEMSWQEVYHKLYDQCDGKGGGGDEQSDGGGAPGGQGSSQFGDQFDGHLAPGTSSGKDPEQAKPNEQMWRQAIAGAEAAARAAGNLPANIERLFKEMLEPKVAWTDHIQGIFARRVGSGGYDFRRADRRLIVRDIYAPGRSGHGCGAVAVCLDSSGSIYAVDSLIERFFGELRGIFEELRPKKIFVIWCDAEVKRVDEIEDASDLHDCFYKGSVGGGGTSFVPPFQWLIDNGVENLDAIVYLTDGDGGFPDKNQFDCPVIWGDISNSPQKYPWGEVVQIPTDGTA